MVPNTQPAATSGLQANICQNQKFIWPRPHKSFTFIAIAKKGHTCHLLSYSSHLSLPFKKKYKHILLYIRSSTSYKVEVVRLDIFVVISLIFLQSVMCGFELPSQFYFECIRIRSYLGSNSGCFPKHLSSQFYFECPVLLPKTIPLLQQ